MIVLLLLIEVLLDDHEENMRHFFENWEISNNELNVLKLEFEYFFLCVYMYLCMPPIISIIVLNCLPFVGP